MRPLLLGRRCSCRREGASGDPHCGVDELTHGSPLILSVLSVPIMIVIYLVP